MIPKKLRLKNFTGIRSGLNRDEIVIDMGGYTDDDRLIALVGPNGTGKSTILDNLHPYRIMPSRAGSYSPGSFSFYDNIYGAEAVKELEFEHGGVRYRSILVFKMGAKTKKTECYLQFINPFDGVDWEPVRTKDGTISDGKSETYDRCLESILGTPELFFTAAFAAQNRRSLSSYTNGEIKDLLSELLGLEHIAALGKQSGDVAKMLRSHMDGMRDKIAGIEKHEGECAAIESDLSGDQTSLSLTSQAKYAIKDTIAKAAKRLADVKADVGASEAIEIRRSALTAQINGVQMRIGGTIRDIGMDTTNEQNRATDSVNELRREVFVLGAQNNALDRKIKDNEQILSRKTEIDVAVVELKTLEDQERAAIEDLEKKRREADNYRTLISERDRIHEQLKGVTQVGEAHKVACQELQTRASLIDSVPCQGTELQPRCQLLQEAYKAREGIPDADKKVGDSRNEYARLAVRGQELNTTIASIGEAPAALNAAHAHRESIVKKMRDVKNLTDQAPSLAQAQQTIASAREQIDTNESVIAAKITTVDEIVTKSGVRVAELAERMRKAQAEADAELLALQTERDVLPPPADLSVIAQAEAALLDADNEATKIDQEYAQLNARIATHKERLRAIGEQLKNAPSIKTKADTVEKEIAHWTTLAKALSNDGIIALSIDDAGPTLSGFANDLLLSCYGPRFSVSIATQRATASGDLKEDFDIRVFDSERDDDKSVRDMSGGERIWINECLTRAIALYQSQASGQQYGALFADESDGALDPERKQMFIAMKRKVLELGGYQREFFISHTPELWEAADAVIDVSSYRKEE